MARKRRLNADEQVALKVLKRSKYVKNWALGELRAYGVDADSDEGKAFIEEANDRIARRILEAS